jgi:hypothetical protein
VFGRTRVPEQHRTAKRREHLLRATPTQEIYSGVLLACGVAESAVVEGEGIWIGFIVCGEDTGPGGKVA